jgi:hypothetical protein
LRELESLPAHVTQSISRLKLDEDGRPVEITLASKTEAAGMLLRSLPGGAMGEPGNVLQQFNKIERVIVAAPATEASSTNATPNGDCRARLDALLQKGG